MTFAIKTAVPPPTRLQFVDHQQGQARRAPVIDALIEQLPPIGTPWPQLERDAWLHMMATAFVLSYGGPAGGGMTNATRAVASRGATPSRPKPKAKAKAKGRTPAPPRTPDPEFFIDKQHFARKRGGDRIMPTNGLDLVDLRGVNGDITKIVWADESMGCRGIDLNITIADV